MGIKVLLVTTVKWLSTGRLAGAFVNLGCSVEAMLPAGHPASESRYFSRRHPYWPLADVSSLMDAILTSRAEIIVALDDRATALMLRCHTKANPDIRAVIERAMGHIDSYPQLMSRAGFIDAARQADIRTPPTRALACEEDLHAALNETGFPAVLKADGTWGGDGVIIARDREEAIAAFHKLSDPPSRLRSLIRAIRRSDLHFLRAALEAKPAVISIQKFISGKPATTSFACWQGTVLAANHLQAVVTQDGNGPATVLQRIENAQMEAAAERLAARFGLSGLHGLDYMRDETGNTHLIEINPRAPQSSYLSFGDGHDLVAALVGRASGYSRAPRLRVPGEVVALFPQELMRDPASSYLKSAYHDVPWDDPALIRTWIGSSRMASNHQRWEAMSAARPANAGMALPRSP